MILKNFSIYFKKFAEKNYDFLWTVISPPGHHMCPQTLANMGHVVATFL